MKNFMILGYLLMILGECFGVDAKTQSSSQEVLQDILVKKYNDDYASAVEKWAIEQRKTNLDIREILLKIIVVNSPDNEKIKPNLGERRIIRQAIELLAIYGIPADCEMLVNVVKTTDDVCLGQTAVSTYVKIMGVKVLQDEFINTMMSSPYLTSLNAEPVLVYITKLYRNSTSAGEKERIADVVRKWSETEHLSEETSIIFDMQLAVFSKDYLTSKERKKRLQSLKNRFAENHAENSQYYQQYIEKELEKIDKYMLKLLDKAPVILSEQEKLQQLILYVQPDLNNLDNDIDTIKIFANKQKLSEQDISNILNQIISDIYQNHAQTNVKMPYNANSLAARAILALRVYGNNPESKKILEMIITNIDNNENVSHAIYSYQKLYGKELRQGSFMDNIMSSQKISYINKTKIISNYLNKYSTYSIAEQNNFIQMCKKWIALDCNVYLIVSLDKFLKEHDNKYRNDTNRKNLLQKNLTVLNDEQLPKDSPNYRYLIAELEKLNMADGSINEAF